MAYTAPTAVSAGDALTASLYNTYVKDNIIDHEIYVSQIRSGFITGSWTPTLTQGVTVAKTVNSARYIQIGKIVIASYAMTVTGSGTAANTIVMGLPVTAATNGSRGTCTLYDASSLNMYPGIFYISSSTTAQFQTTQTAQLNSQQYLGYANFSAGLANADQLEGSFTYEAA